MAVCVSVLLVVLTWLCTLVHCVSSCVPGTYYLLQLSLFDICFLSCHTDKIAFFFHFCICAGSSYCILIDAVH